MRALPRGCWWRSRTSFRRSVTSGRRDKLTRALLSAALLAATAFAAPSAQANLFRWANDGDVNSMDPYARQETFLLSFMQNVYEPLVRRNRQLQLSLIHSCICPPIGEL